MYTNCTLGNSVLNVATPCALMWHLMYCVLVVAVLVCKLQEDGGSTNMLRNLVHSAEGGRRLGFRLLDFITILSSSPGALTDELGVGVEVL